MRCFGFRLASWLVIASLFAPVPMDAGEPTTKFNTRFFLKIADELFSAVERARYSITVESCRVGGVGNPSLVDYKVAHGRMHRYFPEENLKIDGAAFELAKTIRQAGTQLELWCVSVAVQRSEEANRAMIDYNNLILKATSMFRRYYQELK